MEDIYKSHWKLWNYFPNLTNYINMGYLPSSMVVSINNKGLLVVEDSNILDINRSKIDLLNKDKLFLHKETNFYARQYVAYLCNMHYLELDNPEPISLDKNTLAKCLNWLSSIDIIIRKPIIQYTKDDVSKYISDFVEGKIKSRNPNREIRANSIRFYVRELKRFLSIVQEYESKNSPKYDPHIFEWTRKLKPPKVIRKNYEKFPFLSIAQIVEFSKKLYSEEYRMRMLLSVNLMGRKCEISNLRYKDLESREDKIWIQLPDIKKHSSSKVPVELWTIVKTKLKEYCSQKELKPDDLLFPSSEEAFAKELRAKSLEWIKKGRIQEKITPKTLRKLGVSCAEQLGYSRADVERIGGWSANSEVLNHYFSRKGVALTDKDKQLEKDLNIDIYNEVERTRSDNHRLQKQIDQMKKEQAEMMRMFNKLQNLKKKLNK